MKGNAQPIRFEKYGRRIELSPQQAELIRTGRLSPESVALVEAEIARVTALVEREDDLGEVDDD